MRDILPAEAVEWQSLEAKIRDIMAQYCYHEMRTPIIEDTALFKRSIGEVTDIVEKEMYTFNDLNGDSITLRPENTASLVRASLGAGMLRGGAQRMYYIGPMFRHEKPQRGRYRQFHQVGAEAYGMAGALIEVELIQLSAQFWQALGLQDDVVLEINTLGDASDRARHREHIVAYFEANHSQLDEDSQRRLKTNPLRILDSKNPDMQGLINAAPKLTEFLSEASAQHFTQLQLLLDSAGIEYTVNPRLVRGLDYYCHTVFEWVTTKLGSQGTVCAGGRYDGLIDELGGKNTPAVGWAMGMERLLELAREVHGEQELPKADLFMVLAGQQAESLGVKLANEIRQAMPHLKLHVCCTGGSFKSQFKKADQSGAPWAVVLGDSEAQERVVNLKPLQGGEQLTVPIPELLEKLQSVL